MLKAHRLLNIFNKINSKEVNLVSPKIATFLINHYGGNQGHNYLEGDFTLGYGLIHFSLIKNLRPERVLCVGSTKGFIPAICALACKDNNFGHVDFVDAGYDRNNPNHWGGIGFWKKINPNKHFGQLGLSSWITSFVMTSKHFSKKVKKPTWQYIYIDADHSYEGVKSDFKLFWPRLEKGGLMTFHDVLLKKHPEHNNFGVWKFWKELKKDNKITIPYIIPGAIPSGLGILQKNK